MGCACLRPIGQKSIIYKGDKNIIENKLESDNFIDEYEINNYQNDLEKTDIQGNILKKGKKNVFEENDNIKNFYEKINQSKNYEVIPIDILDTLISPETLSSYEYYENNKEKFENKTENDNIERKSILNSFKMPPIKNKITEEIYEGNYIYDKENDNYLKVGEGKLITKDKNMILINTDDYLPNYENSIVFYNNGNIFIGDISKESPYEKEKGTLFYKDNNNNFSSFLISNNFKSNPIKIKKIFPNKDEYEGDAIIINDKIVLDGNGKYKRKKDNSIYEGQFKNNQFNGKGNLFIPLKNANEDDQGKLITTNWINGIENGKGIIKVKDENNNIKSVNCFFRFGKIINSIQKATSKKVKLHKNIFNFLTPIENYLLAKNTQMKSMLEYLKEDNFKNLNEIKFFGIINEANYDKYKNNKNLNNKLTNLQITNISKITDNYFQKKILFLPIQAYKTDGGQVENRYRYQNIFNPVKNKTYTTHYLHNKNHDVSINGVINYSMFNSNNQNNDLNNKLNNNSSTNQNDLNIISTIIKSQESYIKNFEEIDKNYPECDKYRDVIDNRNIILNNNIVGNINKCLFSVHYISIYIPKKYNYYSLINLPCHFLSVYIHEDDDIKSENCSIDICQNIINQNYGKIDNIQKKFSNDILFIEKSENYSFIEFDTYTQSDKSKKLLCLIEINKINPDLNPYIISLKKYYHIGRYLTIKLIDQNSIYNTLNKNCIDFGTINFYGEVYELK